MRRGRPKKPDQPNVPLRQHVLAAVLGGAVTAVDVVAVVGRYITAAQAARAGQQYYHSHGPGGCNGTRPTLKKPTLADLQYQGRRRVVGNTLIRLYADGKIDRTGKGRYCPLPPKLFDPAQSA